MDVLHHHVGVGDRQIVVGEVPEALNAQSHQTAADLLCAAAGLSDFQRVIDVDGQRVKMPANLTVAHAALLVQAKKAMGGDARALQFLRDTAGEQPVERVEVSGDVAAAAADIGAMVERLKKGDG